jgi:tetrapyrrole methylase family protein/MazG family protein
MTGRVIVVGLGPADADLVGEGVRRWVEAIPAERRFARTDRHPAVTVLGGHQSFDEVYERAERLDDVYPAIVASLIEATSAGDVLYAVPGSPLVAEQTVALLRTAASAGEVEVLVEPALSFLDLAWARLGIDPLAAGVRLVDGQRFATEAAGERGPLLVAQCDTAAVLSAIKLAVAEGPGEPVVVLQRLGLPDESVAEVAWDDLDREIAADHLTSIWIPHLAAPVGAELVRFAELMRTLRAECPWDRRQTHASLRPYLVEETYEVLDVLDRLAAGDAAAHHGATGEGTEVPPEADELEEELGDLLMQVVFHATLAAEQGWFDLADVARGIHDKLVRRHPHVFGDEVAADAEAVKVTWEQIKAAEKAAAGGHAGPTDPFAGVIAGMPALQLATKMAKRMGRIGMGYSSAEDAWADVLAELDELRDALSPAARESELGDVIYALANLARHLDIDAEQALRGSLHRLRNRVAHMAELARPYDLAALDDATRANLWARAKAARG